MAKLSILRGDNYTLTVTVTNTSGTAFDLTGYKAFFTAVANLDVTTITVLDSSASIQQTISSIPTPTAGIIVFNFSPTDTNILPGTYFYDVQIESVAGAVTTILQPDQLIITPDVTRRLV